MLMSKSRLEKFLYALYSLDSSDLPNPISRIEELYKCWVTGEEAPTFEPLSRVEKYLMAILGAYNVNELPNPLSRVEVLLYKLATGDDNLDDIKSFLSEHEELLAEIIRNGGVGGNINIEYLLYTLSTEHNTLYNTAEKPVKSAILKGNTLVNLIRTIGKTNLGQYQDAVTLTQVKPSTKYLLKIKNNTSEAKSFYSAEITGWTQIDIGANQTITKTLTTKSTLGRNTLLQNLKTHTTEHDLSIIFIEYQDGMENWDIPYFEGMQSVKMPVLTTSNEDGTKTNILTINEEVTLHGIGDVRDELNPFTGELTQRIGEFVFDGDERFKMSTSDNNAFFYHELGGDMLIPSFTKKMISNNLLDYANYATMKNTENSMYTNGKSIYIHLTNDINSVSLLQTYLANNPIKIITYLSNESVKTVDLSVVDQDGDNTKLSTFDDLTHVTLSSEGLIPEVKLEVATKNEEDLEDSSVYTVHTLSEEFNTLYNTAEKPVKSAFLKGNTLVNISPLNGEITLAPGKVQFIDISSIKSDTIYTISFNCSCPPSTNFMEFRQAVDNTALKMDNISIVQGYNRFKMTTVNKELNRFRFKNDSTSETDFIFNNLMILEGDYTNVDIPYFEGMQSVKMPVLKTTGKNLFDMSSFADTSNHNNNLTTFPNTWGRAYKLQLKPNTTYVISRSENVTKLSNNMCVFNGEESNRVSMQSRTQNVITTINDGILFFSLSGTVINKEVSSETIARLLDEVGFIQVEEGGSVATSYEPYKSNILTVNEEVELRKLGDVQDELNLLTGELTERIGEVVLDGSEDWVKGMNNTKLPYRFICDNLLNYSNYKEICDSFKTGQSYWSVDTTGLYIGGNHKLVITFKSDDDRNNYTAAEFKQYLSENPITVQYQLATESVKTVDLSTVNQDGDNTKLSTFNDITHVTLSSEGLIPKAELEVAEKVPEVAASMLTISREQEVIDATTNEQSENVDATMIATTEIYEELL